MAKPGEWTLAYVLLGIFALCLLIFLAKLYHQDVMREMRHERIEKSFGDEMPSYVRWVSEALKELPHEEWHETDLTQPALLGTAKKPAESPTKPCRAGKVLVLVRRTDRSLELNSDTVKVDVAAMAELPPSLGAKKPSEVGSIVLVERGGARRVHSGTMYTGDAMVATVRVYVWERSSRKLLAKHYAEAEDPGPNLLPEIGTGKPRTTVESCKFDVAEWLCNLAARPVQEESKSKP